MTSFFKSNCIITILVLCTTSNICVCSSSNDPYAILGINRIATTYEIREAYKQLAKKWHPDKVPNDNDAEKFIRIKQAYELLTDMDRRRIFDRYGVSDTNSQYLQTKHDYSEYNRFALNHDDDEFEQRFNINQDIAFYHKLSITANYFENIILSKNAKKVHVVMFYNDWCFQCTRIVEAFKKILDLLQPIGINFATVNAVHEESIFRKCGAREVPQLVLILNNQYFLYRDQSFTPQKVVGL
ncbi:dnaJ homolog subfamily C member 16 isoform X2 [Drosophila erecta]|uniref:dnaJ homolog subfamily C member 16 isoform X2 n=1 Tax=Drosophila erecta TaxID=7220 RepID=UPI000F04A022|nr:dnaJ homolog subfamily C member 16 isoform X2 [Drosophila erecta]